MPRNAIAAGCVDFVLSPAKIAQELGKIALHAQVVPQSLLGPAEPAQIADHYEKVLHLLKTRTGVDFSLYKPITLERRIARRMVLNKIPKLPAYLTFLRSHPSELEALYQDVLIHVTSFFRDPETFEVLKQKVFPRMIKSRTPDDPVRAWVLGCSTGQEAYSIAMAYLEFASKASSQVPLQIFATDLNETLLEKSRAGLYSKAQVQDLSPERLRRFFLQEDGGFRICKPVRELCVFARHDVLADAPFSRLDLLSCRNLLIYITPASQNRLLPLFHYALKPKGFLLLGSSETVGNFSDLFAVEDKTHRIFSKKTQTNSSDLTFEFKKEGRKSSLAQQPSASAVRLTRELDAQKEADRLTIARYGPPGVLINEAMQILQFRGQTSPYLEPAAGKASFDLLKMAREGLMLPVRAAFQKAKSHNQAARLEDVAVRCEGQVRRVNVEIIPLNQLRERCFLVNFEPIADLPPEGKHQARKTESVRQSSSVPTEPLENRRLRNELSASREYLQSVSEQYEALNEELQATNEEAQSSNEELRSINEELETTKEELQSTNEELTTVNDEMNHRNLELHRTNSDLNNVLASVQMCIVVLGGDLSIRRFTSLAKRILNL